MCFTFPLFFTLSPAAVVENTPLQASCSRAGSVELRLEAGGHDVGLRSEACSPNSLWAARPRSVGPWTGEASYSRGSPCRRLTFSRVFVLMSVRLPF